MKPSVGRTGGTCESVLELVQVRREPWKPGADANLPWSAFLQEVTTAKKPPKEKCRVSGVLLARHPSQPSPCTRVPGTHEAHEAGMLPQAVEVTRMCRVTPHAAAHEASRRLASVYRQDENPWAPLERRRAWRGGSRSSQYNRDRLLRHSIAGDVLGRDAVSPAACAAALAVCGASPHGKPEPTVTPSGREKAGHV